MRILNIPNSDPVPGEGPAGEPKDPERMGSLEKITASILQKLQTLDERMSDLEKAPQAPVTASAPAPAPAPEATPTPRLEIHVDAEAVKKNLLAKMWTYLNDKAA